MAENLPIVDRFALTDGTKLVLEKLADGKIRVTSSSFVEEKVILADQVLEVRSFEGKIRIGRKARLPDAGDPPRVASDYDPYQTDDDLLVEEAPAAVVDPANVVV
jgi:hypothetical protein